MPRVQCYKTWSGRNLQIFIVIYSVTGKHFLLKGKTQYSWPPCTNQFRLAALDIGKIIYIFTKQATLTRRSTVLSFPLQLVFPALAFSAGLFMTTKKVLHDWPQSSPPPPPVWVILNIAEKRSGRYKKVQFQNSSSLFPECSRTT